MLNRHLPVIYHWTCAGSSGVLYSQLHQPATSCCVNSAETEKRKYGWCCFWQLSHRSLTPSESFNSCHTDVSRWQVPKLHKNWKRNCIPEIIWIHCEKCFQLSTNNMFIAYWIPLCCPDAPFLQVNNDIGNFLGWQLTVATLTLNLILIRCYVTNVWNVVLSFEYEANPT